MKQDVFLQMFLKQNLDIVREKLGRNCSFLSFERYKDVFSFRARMINDRGGKDNVRVLIKREKISDMEVREFNDLFDILNTKSYESV